MTYGDWGLASLCSGSLLGWGVLPNPSFLEPASLRRGRLYWAPYPNQPKEAPMGYTSFDARGYPVVDATQGMIVHTVDADLIHAVPLDHCHCAMAQSIQRCAGVGPNDVIIEATMSHVLMPCDDTSAREHNKERPHGRKVEAGELVWMRFENSHQLRDAIQALDTGGEFPRAVYTLHRVPTSSRLAEKSKRGRKRRAAKKAAAKAGEQPTRVKRLVQSGYARPRKMRFAQADEKAKVGA